MRRYKISNLTRSTSVDEQRRLLNALRKVQGVHRATLRPSMSELEVRSREGEKVQWTELEAAAARVGFSLTSDA